MHPRCWANAAGDCYRPGDCESGRTCNCDNGWPQYAGTPKQLEKEHIDPHIPWLYGYKLDFAFR